MLTITKRPVHIGGHINATTEKHGEDDVSAVDIALEGIMLSAEELNALLNDPKASAALFVRSNGSFAEPMFPQLKPLALKDAYEGATVRLTVGLKADELVLGDCKLRNIKLTPQAGGMTEMSLSVRARPNDDELIATLFRYMNHDEAVEIADAKVAEKGGKQKDLALNTFGEGEQGEQGDEAENEEADEAGDEAA